MPMRRFAFVFFLISIAAAACASAQVAESANTRELTITAGGFGSAFNPHDSGNAFYSSESNYLVGLGTYVDVHFSRWIQVEGEARWLRFNGYGGEHQDHYLVGPKLPIHQFGRANAYGKVLIGLGRMTFPYNYGYGSFTALAYGGGIDYRMSRKLTFRAVDFEFQQWPSWLPGSALYPYGVSVGLGYRLF
jgi:hypothetical protein